MVLVARQAVSTGANPAKYTHDDVVVRTPFITLLGLVAAVRC